jgi:hypothetical protein
MKIIIQLILLTALNAPLPLVAQIDSLMLEQPIEKISYYKEPGSYGTKRESDPPSYTRNLSKIGKKDLESINWLNVGLDYRIRFEHRNNDIRRPESFNNDNPFLHRTRDYLGIQNIIDPLRLVVEFEDARRTNGIYPLDDRDVNELEIIQGYAELNFKKALGTDGLGNDKPVLIRGGRMVFEFMDRRLIASNQWRNTTNNFIGLRATFGQEKNDWQLDLLALQPIVRLIDEFDKNATDKLFWSAIGHWRKWSKIITIEPHYLALRQNATNENGNRFREIHATGLRLYGWIYDTGFNYDLTSVYQFGKERTQQHKAFSFTSEIGYTFKKHKWKPRLSLFFGYVSGDKNPNDNENNRFERFFGFARPWSSDDYVVMENIVTPKIKLEFEPVKGVKVDGGYSFYWLASEKDRFNNLLAGSSFNRDATGKSGKDIGHGLDVRVRFKITPFIDANVGYTHFVTGEFVRKRQLAANGESVGASNFAYVELSFNAFDMIKKLKKNN